MDIDPQAITPVIGGVFGLVVMGLLVTAIIRLATRRPLGGADDAARERDRTSRGDHDRMMYGAAGFGVVAGAAATASDPGSPDEARDESAGSSGGADTSGGGGFDGGGSSGGDGGGAF